MTSVYVIGSLRNPQVPLVGNALRAAGFDAFDDWFGGGREADDEWQKYEKTRGRSYGEALSGYLAQNTFRLDRTHLERCDAAVLLAPSGRSAHLELGFIVGRGKPAFVLFPAEPERWDVMYQFCFMTGGDVVTTVDDLITRLRALYG